LGDQLELFTAQIDSNCRLEEMKFRPKDDAQIIIELYQSMSSANLLSIYFSLSKSKPTSSLEANKLKSWQKQITFHD